MGDPSCHRVELSFSFSKLNWALCPRAASTVEGPSSHLELRSKGRVRFCLGPTKVASNVQIDDYQPLARKAFLHRGEVELEFRLRWHWAQGDLPKGTSGVGFWNDPFMMTGWRVPSLPQAFWVLCHDKKSRLNGSTEATEPGCHLMSLDAWSLRFLCHLPFWVLSLPFWFVPLCRRYLWIYMKGQLCFSDRRLDIDLRSWNRVRMSLKEQRLCIAVNEKVVLDCPYRSKKGLGLVIWMDNQHLTWHDSGRLSMGSDAIGEEQWLEVDEFKLRN